MQKTASLITAIAACIIALMLAVIAHQNSRRQSPPVLKTPFQGILLTNGQVFFGRLEGAETPFPVLRDVYYVRSQINSETKQATNTLIKRGQEWHAPDSMILNASHILSIEPVGPDSQMGKLISENRSAAIETPKQ